MAISGTLACLIYAVPIIAISMTMLPGAAEGVTSTVSVVLQNKCSFPIWPAVFPSASSKLSMRMSPNSTSEVRIHNPSMDRDMENAWFFWGRTGCSSFDRNGQAVACDTGDCSGDKCPYGVPQMSPVTLAIFDLTSDLISIYASQGFNLPLSIASQQQQQQQYQLQRQHDAHNAPSLSCMANPSRCPPQLLQLNNNSQRRPVACSPDNNPSLYNNVLGRLCPPAYPKTVRKARVTNSGVYLLSFCS